MKLEEKIKSLLEERETIILEMNELQKSYDVRRQRVIEINGSIKTLQELMSDEQSENEANTTEK